MDVATIAKLFSDGPLPAICALLVLTVVALFGLLMRAHERERKLLERVVLLAERLTPLVERAKRKGGGHAEE